MYRTPSFADVMDGMGSLLPSWFSKEQYVSPLEAAAQYEAGDMSSAKAAQARADEQFLKDSQDLLGNADPTALQTQDIQDKLAAAMAKAGKWSELDTLANRKDQRDTRAEQRSKSVEDRKRSIVGTADMLGRSDPESAANFLKQYEAEFPGIGGITSFSRPKSEPKQKIKSGTLYNASGDSATYKSEEEKATFMEQGYKYESPLKAKIGAGLERSMGASAKATKALPDKQSSSGVPSGFTKQRNPKTGEIRYINKSTGEIIKAK
jgi:hypothetical protein